MNIGLVGCGNVSDIYLKNLTSLFENTFVYACANRNPNKALAAAKMYNIPHVMTFDEMLDCPDIHAILILTPPDSHYELSKRALLAGKHVYVEKPLALTYAEGKELVDIAREQKRYLGCAPDTFLGASLQTCCQLIRDGAIGRPIAATAFMMSHGPEAWHPNPEFFYDFGGGPLFDMGPYYITALVRLLGKADSVFAYGTKVFEERTAGHKDKFGQKIPVKVDTHHAGLIHFENGAVATLVTSFDVWKHSMPHIELYGTEGTLNVPDPNCFSGTVRLYTPQNRAFTEIPLTTPYTENSRGIGLSEMILAANENRINNASGALALHVLEIMEGFVRSAKEGQMILLESSPSKSVAMDWTVNTGELRTK